MKGDQSQSKLVMKRIFACTSDKLWRFWTVPDLMRLWFGSDPQGAVLAASSNPQVNGSFSVTFQNANGTEHTCSGRYLVVDPFTTLSFTWYWSGREQNVEVVSVGFTEVEQGVAMEFTHKDMDLGTSHDYRVGWASTFEKLANAIQKSSELR